MYRRLLALGVALTAISLFCVLITGAYPAEFYASLMALTVSVFMVVLALVAPWALKRFWHVEWAGRGPVIRMQRTDLPNSRRTEPQRLPARRR